MALALVASANDLQGCLPTVTSTRSGPGPCSRRTQAVLDPSATVSPSRLPSVVPLGVIIQGGACPKSRMSERSREE